MQKCFLQHTVAGAIPAVSVTSPLSLPQILELTGLPSDCFSAPGMIAQSNPEGPIPIPLAP